MDMQGGPSSQVQKANVRRMMHLRGFVEIDDLDEHRVVAEMGNVAAVVNVPAAVMKIREALNDPVMRSAKTKFIILQATNVPQSLQKEFPGVEFFTIFEMGSDRATHRLVPPVYTVVDNARHKDVDNYPIISQHDMQMRLRGVKPGQIVHVVHADGNELYRRVVE